MKAPPRSRVGLITTSFPRFERDLAGCFVLGMARALAARGHRVEVLAPEPDELPEQAQSESSRRAWEEEGITLRWVPYLRPRALQRTFYGAGVPENIARDPIAWLGLFSSPPSLFLHAAGRASRWDALLTHWALPSGLIGGLLRRARPTLRHLAVVHSAEVALLSSLPMRGRITGALFEGSSRVSFVSAAHRQRLIGWLPERERTSAERKSFVSPMGVSAPRPLPREQARRALGIQSERPVLLSMGRLVPIKDLRTTLKAAEALPGALLLVAGEGPEEPALRRFAEGRALELRWVGLALGETKRALLGAADLFLFTSKPTDRGRTEGVPTALIEAMMSGLVPIASRTGGVPELIEDGREGLLIEPGDVDAFAAALRALSGCAEGRARRHRMSRAAQERARGFAWPLLIPRFEEALLEG